MFIKYIDFSNLTEADKKALKKVLEDEKKALERALSALGSPKKAKKKKGKKAPK